jgi:hypothetical protein
MYVRDVTHILLSPGRAGGQQEASPLRHSRAGGNPTCLRRTIAAWITACAGMKGEVLAAA